MASRTRHTTMQRFPGRHVETVILNSDRLGDAAMKRHWILAIPLISFWACGGSSSPTAATPTPLPAPPTIQALLIAVPTSLEAGQTVQLRANALLSDGTTQAVAAGSVSWQASDPDVVTISTTGMLSALNAGIVGVHGTYQQWTSSVMSVTVTSPSDSPWDY
jgi:Bacterial Ig-like domain (group 2)